MTNRKTPTPRIALALAGGGPLGAIYEICVLCAIDEAMEGLDLTALHHYVGVSAGGFIAAGLANGMVGIWSARRTGLLGMRRRWQGRFGPDDDGLAGVREPRRPRPSAGAASMSMELPAA